MSSIFHIIALVPLAFIAANAYLVLEVLRLLQPDRQFLLSLDPVLADLVISLVFGVLISLIITAAAVIMTVTIIINHYWVALRTTQQWGPADARVLKAGVRSAPDKK